MNEANYFLEAEQQIQESIQHEQFELLSEGVREDAVKIDDILPDFEEIRENDFEDLFGKKKYKEGEEKGGKFWWESVEIDGIKCYRKWEIVDPKDDWSDRYPVLEIYETDGVKQTITWGKELTNGKFETQVDGKVVKKGRVKN